MPPTITTMTDPPILTPELQITTALASRATTITRKFHSGSTAGETAHFIVKASVSFNTPGPGHSLAY